MENEVLSIILYVVCIAAFVYGIFVIRKLHKISEEADRMLKEIKEENDGE